MIHPNTWLTAGEQNYSMEDVSGSCSNDGLLQRYAYHPISRIPPFPLSLSPSPDPSYRLTPEEAASIFTAGMTAFTCLLYGLHALHHTSEPLSPNPDPTSLADLKDRTVLVQGTGGVSLFGAQLAVAAGARVIATTSSASKAECLKGLGVRDVIDYRRTPDWDAEALRLTDGKGLGIVIEVGGAGTIGKSLKAAKYGSVGHCGGDTDRERG